MMLSRKGVHESHYGEDKVKEDKVKVVPHLQFGTLPAVSYDYATGKFGSVSALSGWISVDYPYSKSCKQEVEDYEHVAAVATSGNVKVHKLCKQKIVDFPSDDNNSTPSDDTNSTPSDDTHSTIPSDNTNSTLSDDTNSTSSSVEDPYSKEFAKQEIEDYEHAAAVATSGNVKVHKLCKQKLVDYPSDDTNSTPSDDTNSASSSVEDPYSKEFAKQESSKQEIEDHEHAAAVATSGNFKAHKFFPVAKEVAKVESCKQKIVDYPSDDTNSTSGTIEYPYSEEEYPSDDVYSGDEDYKDDESEGDEDEKDEGMTDSTDEIEDDDFGAVFSREGMADSTDEIEDDDFGAIFSREGMADSTDEIDDDDSGAASSLVSGSDVSHKKRQDKDEWIDSWEKLGLQQHWTWVNVYAYYNKVKGYGGYGVVLRNAAAQPISASAVFSKDGKYFFYQVLMGIMAGVELAEKNGFSNLYVRCNSFKVPRMFSYVRNCSNDKCRDQNSVCGDCSNFFAWHYGCDRRVMPLVLGLKCKDIVVDVVSSWGKNAAAHYLAGMAKENRKVKGVLADHYQVTMEPNDFPEKLKDILWEDLSDYNRVVE